MSTFYLCDGCGALATYLSDSWSTVLIAAFELHKNKTMHFCLECRTAKLVLPPKETDEPAQ